MRCHLTNERVESDRLHVAARLMARSLDDVRPEAEHGEAARPVSTDRITIASVIDRVTEAPVATSRNRGWSGATIDTYERMPVNMKNVPAYDHHVLAYCTTVGGRLIQKRAGRVHDGRLSIGMSVLMPAGHEASWEGDFPASTRIRIPTELIARAAEEVGGEIELLNNFGVRDTNIECFARLFADELGKPPHPAQRLIVDAVSCAVVVHLLRNYNAFDAAIDTGPPSLTTRTVGKIMSYIEDNMQSTIGLLELAAIAGVSRFHFARLFKNSLGETPMSYVERMRIERAKGLIQQGRLSLVDVALTVGFADQSHFTRRFHRHMGCTPAAYARNMGLRLQPRR